MTDTGEARPADVRPLSMPRSTRTPVAATGLLLACVLATSACTGSTGTNANAASSPQLKGVGGLDTGVFPAATRRAAPQLAGTTLDGARLDVGSLRGKVVVLNFWASWCAPCRAEARNLNAVYAQTKQLGVAFVGVDIKDDDSAARAYQRAKAVAYPSLYDEAGALLLAFRGSAPQSPPTTLILDRRGRVAARFVQPVTEAELLVPVQALAAENA